MTYKSQGAFLQENSFGNTQRCLIQETGSWRGTHQSKIFQNLW